MSSTIDTMLKVTATPAKPAAPTAARESAEEFDNYLRQAASSQTTSKKLTKDQAPNSPQPEETVATSSDQQGTTSSPDDEANNTVIESESVAEEEADATIVDEVLLSAAASVTVTPATEIVTTVEFTGEELVSEPITARSQTEPTASGNSTAATLWGDELEAANAKESVLPVNADQADVITTFTTDTMAAVVEETTATGEQVTGESQAELAADPYAESVTVQGSMETQTGITQTATAESKSSPPIDSEDKIPDEVQEIDAQVSELAIETTTEFDGKTPEVNSKSTETPAPAAPTNAGSQQTVQPTHGGHGSNAPPVAKQDSDPALSTVDRARFVQRVANAFRSAQNNDGHIQLRLSPPELGSLRIEIAVRNGVLSANLETETADARRVLLDNLPSLRQRLAEQDIRIEKFEVDIRREGGQPDGQANAREQQSEQQSQRGAMQNRIRTHSTTSEIHTSRVASGSISGSDAALDVRV